MRDAPVGDPAAGAPSPIGASATALERGGGARVSWLGRAATAPWVKRWAWGAGAAPLGLLAEAAAVAHGPVPLWLDRPMALAPELGLALDYVRFAHAVAATSGWLHAAGVGPGDTVAIVKAHNLDVVVLAQASARLGAVPALLAPGFDAATVAELLGRLDQPIVVADRAAIAGLRLREVRGARLLLCADGPADGALALAELRGALVPPARPRDDGTLVAITHTSGTTGVPKLIGHSGDSLAGQSAVQVLGGRLLLGAGDVVATCLTTAHARTLSGLAAVAAVGAPHLFLVDPDPATAATLLARHRPTVVESFPNVLLRWEALADDPRAPFANVRLFLSTFDAAHPRTIRRLLGASRRRPPLYAQAYAQSELGAITLSFRTRRGAAAGDARDIGWPALALSRVRLVDPTTGRTLRAPGRSGRIQVRGPGLFAGYVGEADRTRAQALDGWWDTGDLGARRRDGRLRLLGRVVDDVPGLPDYLAVEDRLLDRLAELTELVITTDAQGTPLPVVCTRGDAPLDPARWRDATADLPALGAPRQYRWDELPKTATWKVRRPALRALLRVEPAPA